MLRSIVEFERLLSFLAEEIKFDIPLQQLRLLFIVAANPGITQTELTELLGLHQATISRNVKKMGEEHIITENGTVRTVGWGLLKTQQDTRFDSRRLAVYLTKKGERIITKFNSAWGASNLPRLGGSGDGDQIRSN